MKIYHFSPRTSELLSESDARCDPLEPDRYLIPAFATNVAPPVTSEIETAVFNGSAWEIMPDLRGTEYWLAYGDKRTISEIGETVPDGALLSEPSQPSPSPTQIEAAKVAIVQRHMDDAARVYRYDDIKTACTYADEPAVPKFQVEGQAFRAWRSLVWAACYAILDEVQSGARGIPTDAELLAELPKFAMPG